MISKSDFSFTFVGHGHYKVWYQSPVTGKTWSKVVNDMHLIDSIRFSDKPKKSDLNTLKRIIKN